MPDDDAVENTTHKGVGVQSRVLLGDRLYGPHADAADRVLDLDSFDVDAFSDVDDRRLRAMLRLAGFHPIDAGPPLRSVPTGA